MRSAFSTANHNAKCPDTHCGKLPQDLPVCLWCLLTMMERSVISTAIWYRIPGPYQPRISTQEQISTNLLVKIDKTNSPSNYRWEPES